MKKQQQPQISWKEAALESQEKFLVWDRFLDQGGAVSEEGRLRMKIM